MENLRKMSDDKKAKKQFGTSCNHCSRFFVIPLYEGQIDTCHWLGSTEKENDFVHTDNLIIMEKKEDGGVRESVAHLFRVKKNRVVHCEFYKSKNDI